MLCLPRCMPSKIRQLRPTHWIAIVLLDLDYAGAEVGENTVGERPRHVEAEIEHQDTVKWSDMAGRAGCGRRDRSAVALCAIGCRPSAPRSKIALC